MNLDTSPMAALMATLASMARQRDALARIPFPGDDEEARERYWLTLLQDAEMALHMGMVQGIRTPWIRRVAVPLIHAQRTLEGKDPDKKAKAAALLMQCTDTGLRERCLAWLNGDAPRESPTRQLKLGSGW